MSVFAQVSKAMKANTRLKYPDESNSPSWNPLVLTALDAKVAEDDSSLEKGRRKKSRTYVYASPAQTAEGLQCWSHEKTKDLFSLPQKSDEEVNSELYEDIQCLSLEDFKVFKKRVPRRLSPVRNLWKQDDFPGLEKFSRGKHRCGERGGRQRMEAKDGKLQDTNGGQLNSVSTQTYNLQFGIDLSAPTPDALLFNKLPKELRGTVMNIIYQNNENQSLIMLLSCLLYKFMVSVLQNCGTIDALTDSDAENIKSVLFNEMRSLNYFSSRATVGRNRVESVNICFTSLFERYPGLKDVPGFSDIVSSCPSRPAV